MAGYTRNDVLNNIADGNVISAADLDGEFDAIDAAFDEATGHVHDGNNNGAPITKIGPAQDLVVSTGGIIPKTDNTVDLGSASFEFKDLHIDGVANIDSLVADTADINAGSIDGTIIGGAAAAAGTFTTLNTSSTVTLGVALPVASGGTGSTSTTFVNLATNVTGTLPVANGGTGITSLGTGVATFLETPSSANLAAAVTDETGTGELVFATSPTLVTPILGTPTSGTLTNATGLPLTTGVTGTLPVANGGTGSTSTTFVNLTTNVTGTLPVASGGTGITSFGAGVATFLGTPSSANLASAVTDETGTGELVFATSPTLVTPVLGTPTSGTLSNCTVDGTDAVGFRTIPQNSQSDAYELVLADSGKHILHPSADTTARTFTIPANSSVAYPIGTALTFINQNSAGVVTIAITTDTMRLSPAGTTGSRTLAANGSATCIKLTSTEWIISGSGLT